MAYLKAGKIVLNNPEHVTPAILLRKNEASGEVPFDIAEGAPIHVKKGTFLRGLIFGRISGTMGVTSALLICIGGIYLFVTKTASRTIILSLIITYAGFNQLLYLFGVKLFLAPGQQSWEVDFYSAPFSWRPTPSVLPKPSLQKKSMALPSAFALLS